MLTSMDDGTGFEGREDALADLFATTVAAAFGADEGALRGAGVDVVVVYGDRGYDAKATPARAQVTLTATNDPGSLGHRIGR
jgi:hypothetical protein